METGGVSSTEYGTSFKRQIIPHQINYLVAIKRHIFFYRTTKLQEHVDQADQQGGLSSSRTTSKPFEEDHEAEITDKTLKEDHLRDKGAVDVERLSLESVVVRGLQFVN